MSKILIIEDEVAIADLEKDYLELSDFKVDICNTGDEGLKTALAILHSDLIFHGKKHTPAVLAAPGADKKVITCISVTKTFNLAGLQASTTVFPCLEMKKKFDSYWGGMDIHRNNAFSSVAMEAALKPLS